MEAAFILNKQSKELTDQEGTEGSFSPIMKITGQKIDSPSKEIYDRDTEIEKFKQNNKDLTDVKKVVRIDLSGNRN